MDPLLPEKCTNNTRKCKWDNFGMNVFLSVMGAGVLLAAWLLMQQAARNQVVHEFSEAVRYGNINILSQKTDWVSLREAMKNDLRQHDPSLQPKAVDAMVDRYVRPESLMDIVYYYNQYNTNSRIDPMAFVSNARFSGITEFTIEIAVPMQEGNSTRMEPVRADFALDGLAE